MYLQKRCRKCMYWNSRHTDLWCYPGEIVDSVSWIPSCSSGVDPLLVHTCNPVLLHSHPVFYVDHLVDFAWAPWSGFIWHLITPFAASVFLLRRFCDFYWVNHCVNGAVSVSRSILWLVKLFSMCQEHYASCLTTCPTLDQLTPFALKITCSLCLATTLTMVSAILTVLSVYRFFKAMQIKCLFHAITSFRFNSRFSGEHRLASFHCFSSFTSARREPLGMSSTGFFTVWMPFLLTSVLWRCWLGGRKGIRPVKNMGDGGGGHWLVRMEWRPAGWSVCLPLLIFPCTIKSRSSLLAPAYPGGPGKGP